MQSTRIAALLAAVALGAATLIAQPTSASARPCSVDDGCTHGKPTYQFCGPVRRTITWVAQGADGWYVGVNSSGSYEWAFNPASIGDTTYLNGAPYQTKVRNAC